MKRFALLIPAALSLAGCDADVMPSDQLPLSNVYATYVLATEAGKSPVASAQLRLGDANGEALVLGGGDAISCAGIPLERDDTTPAPRYSAVIASPPASIDFVLTRPGEGRWPRRAETSPALRITSPAFAGNYDAQLDLRWVTDDTREGTITIEASSADPRCTHVTLVKNGVDRGAFAFDGSSFRPADKSDVQCSYTVAVERDVDSDIGPPFVGGVLVSRSVATTSFAFHIP